jgi:hypothetical protein
MELINKYYKYIIYFIILLVIYVTKVTINISTDSNNISSNIIYTEDYTITDNNDYSCELGVLYYIHNPYYNINKDLVSCEELVIEDNVYQFSDYNENECLIPNK